MESNTSSYLISRINFRTGMNEHTFTHKLVSKQEHRRSKIALRSGSEITHLSMHSQRGTLKIIMVPGAKFWQRKTVSLLIETVKKIMAFHFFQRASCTFGKQFRSSGHHSLGEGLLVLFADSSSQTCLGCVRFQTKVTTPQNFRLRPL